MAFSLQLGALFALIQSDINAVRSALGLPALNGPSPTDTPGNGLLAIGQEYIPFNLNAPSIIIHPTGEEPLPAQRTGSPSSVAFGTTESAFGVATPSNPNPNQIIQPSVASLGRKIYWSSWLNFDAYIWGDPDPLATGFPFTGNPAYDFDSSLELRRQFLQALYRNGGGIPGVRWTSGRWMQPQDVKRWGRMYVLSFSIKQPIAADPYLFIAFSSTVGDGGVVISTTIVLQSPDGSSTDNIGPIISPPA